MATTTPLHRHCLRPPRQPSVSQDSHTMARTFIISGFWNLILAWQLGTTELLNYPSNLCHCSWSSASSTEGILVVLANVIILIANYFIFLYKSFIFYTSGCKIISDIHLKLDIRMSAGYRNIYSIERSGCIAIEVKSGCCNFLQYSKLSTVSKHEAKRKCIPSRKTFLTLKNLVDNCIDQMPWHKLLKLLNLRWI